MKRKVSITVLVENEVTGMPRIESAHLLVDDAWAYGGTDLVGREARLLAEKAIYGRYLPTSTREGGRA